MWFARVTLLLQMSNCDSYSIKKMENEEKYTTISGVHYNSRSNSSPAISSLYKFNPQQLFALFYRVREQRSISQLRTLRKGRKWSYIQEHRRVRTHCGSRFSCLGQLQSFVLLSFVWWDMEGRGENFEMRKWSRGMGRKRSVTGHEEMKFPS